MKKLTLILLILPSVLFGQVDIVKRKVTLDSLNSRGAYIFLNDNAVLSGNLSFGVGGPAVYQTGAELYFWDDSTGAKSLTELSAGGGGSSYLTLSGNYLRPNINSYNFSVGQANTIGYSSVIHKFLVKGTSYFDGSAYLSPGSYLSFIGSASINEFSTDILLSGNSNTAVPTEKAVKTYVDNNISAIGASLWKTGTGLNNIYAASENNNLILGQPSTFAPITYKLLVNGTSYFNGPVMLDRNDHEILFVNGDSLDTDSYLTWDGLTFGVGTWSTKNLYVGIGSGASTTTGTSNTTLGVNSGVGINDGSDNVFLGYSVGYNNISGSTNTFAGANSGAQNVDGYGNTFLGGYSGFSNTTGYHNTFIGDSAGYANTNGKHNTFLGAFSGQKNIGAEDNTFIGYFSGNANTAGSYSTMVGYYAGSANTDGIQNTFVGYYAGATNTSGGYNTIMGNHAGRLNQIGNYNTLYGSYAGYSNTNGHSNTFVGLKAGYSNTTGDKSVAIGDSAGYSNSSGNNNVFLGYQAGYSETGSNKLYIENSSSTAPLIEGDFSANTLQVNGALVMGDTYTAGYDTVSGNWTDFNVAGISYLEFNGAYNATITSFIGGVKGQIVYVVNTTSIYTLSLVNDGTGTQKISSTGLGVGAKFLGTVSAIIMICDGTTWHVIGENT